MSYRVFSAVLLSTVRLEGRYEERAPGSLGPSMNENNNDKSDCFRRRGSHSRSSRGLLYRRHTFSCIRYLHKKRFVFPTLIDVDSGRGIVSVVGSLGAFLGP